MKALNAWGWILILCAIVLYFAGIFLGGFTFPYPYGPGDTAKILFVLIVVCLLLGITSLITYCAIRDNKK